MKCIFAGNDLDGCCMVADSAIGRDSMPLFVPDEGDWALQLWLAFRVGRLGKNVAEKFALRYIDAASLVALMLPAGGEMPSWLAFADSALTTGAWLPIPAEGDYAATAETEPLAGGAPQTLSHSWPPAASKPMPVPGAGAAGSIHISSEGIEEALRRSIALVTKVATIKTGDIIIPPLPPIPIPLTINTRLRATLNGTHVLNLKIK